MIIALMIFTVICNMKGSSCLLKIKEMVKDVLCACFSFCCSFLLFLPFVFCFSQLVYFSQPIYVDAS